MNRFKVVKHILVVSLIVGGLLLLLKFVFGNSFFTPITHFFVYRANGFIQSVLPYRFPEASKDIVIIKIDDTSLNALQSNANIKMLTISKSTYADLITRLKQVGVKGIAFDIVFQNKDPDEQNFAQVMQDADGVVIATAFSPNTLCQRDEDSDIETCNGVPRSLYKEVPWGMINLDVLGDRRVMREDFSYLPFFSGNTIISALSLTLFQELNISGHPVWLNDTDGANFYPKGKQYDDFQISKEYLTPFFGPPRYYNEIRFDEVLAMSKLDLVTNFSGKYVFIGESGTLIHDAHISPVTGTLMDGVETHAHLFDGLMRGSLPWTLSSQAFVALIAGLLIFFVSLYLLLPKYLAPGVVVVSLYLVLVIVRYVYREWFLVLDVGSLLLVTSILSFPTAFIYRFFIIDGEKRYLTQAFSRYVDPMVVRQIANQAKSITLGGEARELSVMFSDIAGFTTISEKLDPKDLFTLMSLYLSRMTGILVKNGGTLDKYIGDAVMGFFGAPLTQPDHAVRICRTAIEMRDALPGFNEQIKTYGLDPIEFRIGIATGEVLVGNIGSEDRFNYTVLGDTVNLASRLEATSKEYGTRIILAESTYEQIRNDFFCRKLDLIAVKGKTKGVWIYELVADIHDHSIAKEPYEQYEAGLDLYMSGNYIEAGKVWEKNIGKDTPSRAMMERCIAILRGEIVVEDGVYRMTHK